MSSPPLLRSQGRHSFRCCKVPMHYCQPTDSFACKLSCLLTICHPCFMLSPAGH